MSAKSFVPKRRDCSGEENINQNNLLLLYAKTETKKFPCLRTTYRLRDVPLRTL